MLRANLWNDSVSRVELDQRARDARLRLERIERLLVTRAVVTYSRRRRLLCLFKVGIQYGERRLSRSRGPLRNRRPSRTPTIHEVWLEMCSSCG
jgi:hypothetical protein